MSKANKQTLDLETLAEGTPRLTRELCEFYSQAACVCLANRGHEPGVALWATGEMKGRYELRWGELDPRAEKSFADLEEAVEYGACAVTFLLARVARKQMVIERSVKKTGFDFWLGNEGDPLFQRKTRLEVSGVLKGESSTVRQRLKRKLEQTKRSDDMRVPALASVVEFGKPRSNSELRS